MSVIAAPQVTITNSNTHCDQFTIGNLAVFIMTQPNQAIHYAIYLKRDGNDYILTAWIDYLTGRRKTISEIIAEAYQRVFMWIRPQLVSGLFIDNLNDRDLFLSSLNNVHTRVLGNTQKMIHNGYIFHEERQLVSMKGTAKLFRTYNCISDTLFTHTILMPFNLGGAGFTRCEVLMTDGDYDPGDFIEGEWTPSTRDPMNMVPVVDEFDATNERPGMY